MEFFCFCEAKSKICLKVSRCVHGFMNPMPSCFVCGFFFFFFFRSFNILCYASSFYMLLFVRQIF